MKRILPMLAVTLLTAAGCAHLDYVGKTYAPTQNVDVVFSERDLQREYTVIGQLVATGDDLVSTSGLQKKIVERARQVGADAVIIEGMDRVVTGSTTNYTESRKDKDKDHDRRTSGTAVTTTQESKRIHARFIRYKDTRPDDPGSTSH